MPEEQSVSMENEAEAEGQEIGINTAYPVFCTTDIPTELMDELITTHIKLDLATGVNTLVFLDITKAENKSLITHGDLRPCKPLSTPFTNWSIDDLYAYWKAKFQAPQDGQQPSGWTAFTFCVLDETSLRNHDLVMCSDGPDFNEGDPQTGEDEIKLKSIRMSFADFCESMSNLEVLGCTPSEVNNELHLKVIPPAWMVPEYPGALSGRVATPAEARSQKRQVIWRAEASGRIVDGAIRPD